MGKYDSLVAEAPPKKGKYDDLVAETPPVAAPLEPPIATPSRAQLAAATGKLDAPTTPPSSREKIEQDAARQRESEQRAMYRIAGTGTIPGYPGALKYDSSRMGAAGRAMESPSIDDKAAGLVTAGEEAMKVVLPAMAGPMAAGGQAALAAGGRAALAKYAGTVGAVIRHGE